MGERFWIGTSWKMNKTLREATHWITAVGDLPVPVDVSLFVMPPFTALAHVARLTENSSILIGAQNVHAETDGAHTGDVSARLVADAGAKIVEIGHQERRRDQGETDSLINEKAHRAHEAGLRPLLCVGDLAADRTHGTTEEAIARQVKIGLHRLPADARPMIAYEPAWSIGVDGTPATPAQIIHAHRLIRRTLTGIYGEPAARNTPILYGGGVTPENCGEIAALAEVDGLFVGRAALEPEQFLAIIDTASATRHQGQR